jgi:hypothetical protein
MKLIMRIKAFQRNRNGVPGHFFMALLARTFFTTERSNTNNMVSINHKNEAFQRNHKGMPDYRTEGVVGGDSNNMYIEVVSRTFLTSFRVTCEHSNNMLLVLFNIKKASLSRSFFE